MAPLILLLATVCSIAQGQLVYNYNTEICCNGTIHKKPLVENYNYECCGTELLWQSTKYEDDEFCCGNTVLSKEDGLDCCGETTYDPKKSDCYNKTTVADIPEDDFKEGKTHSCGVSFDKIKFYNIKTHLCCEGNIREKESRSHLCCGKEVHDSLKTACCDGVVIPREPGSILTNCGQNLYNPNTQICCKNNVYDRPEEPVDTDGNEVHTLQERSFIANKRRYYSTGDCCGGELYNRTSQKCCRSTKLNAEGVYEEQTGVHFSEGGESQYIKQCCGTKLYDTNTQECRNNDEVYNKGDAITRHCCKSTYKWEAKGYQWLKVEDQSDVADDDWCFLKGSSITIYNGQMVETCYENTWSTYNSSLSTCYINGQVENYDSSRQVCCPNGKVDIPEPKEDDIEQDPNPQWQCYEVQ